MLRVGVRTITQEYYLVRLHRVAASSTYLNLPPIKEAQKAGEQKDRIGDLFRKNFDLGVDNYKKNYEEILQGLSTRLSVETYYWLRTTWRKNNIIRRKYKILRIGNP